MKKFFNVLIAITLILIACFIVYPIYVVEFVEPVNAGPYCASAFFATILLSPVMFGLIIGKIAVGGKK